jgi:hypothetical protein
MRVATRGLQVGDKPKNFFGRTDAEIAEVIATWSPTLSVVRLVGVDHNYLVDNNNTFEVKRRGEP